MNVYKLADALEKIETYNQVIHRSFNDKTKLTASADMLRQQADRIAELEKENSNLKYEISSGAWQPKKATDQELFNIYAHLQDTYEGDNFPVALGRTILKLYTTPQTKPLSDEEIEYYEHLIAKLFNVSIQQKVIGLDRIIRAIEERHGIK